LDSVDRVRAADGRGSFDDALTRSLSGRFGSHLKSAHSVADLFCDAIQFAFCHECSLTPSLTSHGPHSRVPTRCVSCLDGFSAPTRRFDVLVDATEMMNLKKLDGAPDPSEEERKGNGWRFRRD
jgi:hypothetical protein